MRARKKNRKIKKYATFPPFFFLLSRSSSGKTTLVKRALARLGSNCRVYLLNVRPDEVAGYVRVHAKTQAIDCSKLKEGLEQVGSNSYVVIEDIISLSDKDEESLRQLINYRAHHDRLRIVCVSHMLYKTSLLTLVPLFNYIVFTLTNSSRGLLRAAAVHGFNLEPEKHAKWLSIFSRCFKDKQGGFIFISCVGVELYRCADGASSTVNRLDDDDDDDGESARATTKMTKSKRSAAAIVGDGGGGGDNLERRFVDCFSDREEKATAAALFAIVGPVLRRERSFRHSDLSLAFRQSRKPGVLRRVSVVDYAASLLQASPSHRPSNDHLVLHRFLSGRCKIPKLFVKNHHFYDAASDLTSEELEDDDDDDDDDDGDVGKAALP